MVLQYSVRPNDDCLDAILFYGAVHVFSRETCLRLPLDDTIHKIQVSFHLLVSVIASVRCGIKLPRHIMNKYWFMASLLQVSVGRNGLKVRAKVDDTVIC